MAQYQQAAQEQNMQRQAQFQQQRDVRMAGLQRQQAEQNYQKQLAFEDYRFGTDGTQSQFEKSRGIQNLENSQRLFHSNFKLGENSKLRERAQKSLQEGFIYNTIQETQRTKWKGNIAREEDRLATGDQTLSEFVRRRDEIQSYLDNQNPIDRPEPNVQQQFEQETHLVEGYGRYVKNKNGWVLTKKDDSQFKLQEQQYERTQAESKQQYERTQAESKQQYERAVAEAERQSAYDKRVDEYEGDKLKSFDAQNTIRLNDENELTEGLDWKTYSRNYENRRRRPIPPAIPIGTEYSADFSGPLPAGGVQAQPQQLAPPQGPPQLPQQLAPPQGPPQLPPQELDQQQQQLSPSPEPTRQQQVFQKIADQYETAVVEGVMSFDFSKPVAAVQSSDMVINGKNLLKSPSPIVEESAKTYFDLTNSFVGQTIPPNFHNDYRDALLVIALGYSKFPMTDADVRVIPDGVEYIDGEFVRRRPGTKAAR